MLNTAKHIKLFQRNLQHFPSQYTPYDSSRTSLVYFCIAGLALLTGKTELENSLVYSRQDWIDWVYEQLVESQDGFRGSSSHKIPGNNRYDVANIAPTFFCLSILAILRDQSLPTRLPRNKILRYIGQCQRADGSFAGCTIDSIPTGEHDARYTYMAAGICQLLGVKDMNTVFDVERASQFIHNSKCYDGGIADSPGGESHAGFTYCGIAALKIMDKLDSDEWADTIAWLSKRQFTIHTNNNNEQDDYGGFDGRCNKPADTCYSFWCGGALEMLLAAQPCYDYQLNQRYLLEKTQHALLGGFGKYQGVVPDPLHSYLGLASLALQDSEQKFDAMLCMPSYASEFTTSLYQ